MTQAQDVRAIRMWLGVLIAGLVISGITAFPLETELGWLLNAVRKPPLITIATSTHLLPWISQVHSGLLQTNSTYRFLAYGTDWLAFAHLIIAVGFIGPYREPVRNKWMITFGLLACAGVVPLALIAGQFRGIPFGWRMVDCSFGVFGAIPLLFCRRHIRKLELMEHVASCTTGRPHVPISTSE